MPFLFRALLICILLLSLPLQAAWFEATGQAVIHEGNTQLARKQATQDAIRQALLFAGASVKSVQQMANGLLEQDRFEIRSHGEVNNLELINENYSNGIVTVTIRADIFAQQTFCDAADYRKTIATAFFPIAYADQATVGQIHRLGEVLPDKLKLNFERDATHSQINKIAPFYPNVSTIAPPAVVQFAQRQNTQYVLMGEISDLSIAPAKSAGLAFWRDPLPNRQFSLVLSLHDGHTGAKISQASYHASAPWEFDLHEQIEVSSQRFWQSAYGQAIYNQLQEAKQDIEQNIGCLPAYGRVLHVKNQQLHLNFGKQHGVKLGDELTLFKMAQFHTPTGQVHNTYLVHPTKVKISQLFEQSAIAESADGSLLANIQPNDFVSRQ